MSSAKAYLAPALYRPNVDVLVHTMATKVVQTNIQDGVPVFKRVEFAQSADGGFILMNNSGSG
jgi:choline dehydrogenase